MVPRRSFNRWRFALGCGGAGAERPGWTFITHNCTTMGDIHYWIAASERVRRRDRAALRHIERAYARVFRWSSGPPTLGRPPEHVVATLAGTTEVADPWEGFVVLCFLAACSRALPGRYVHVEDAGIGLIPARFVVLCDGWASLDEEALDAHVAFARSQGDDRMADEAARVEQAAAAVRKAGRLFERVQARLRDVVGEEGWSTPDEVATLLSPLMAKRTVREKAA